MEKFVNVEDPMHHSFLQKGQELKKELENLLGEFQSYYLKKAQT